MILLQAARVNGWRRRSDGRSPKAGRDHSKKALRSDAAPIRDFSFVGASSFLGSLRPSSGGDSGPGRQAPRILHTHHCGSKQVGLFWSVRVSYSYRALAVRDGHVLTWFWIGTHADYDKLLA